MVNVELANITLQYPLQSRAGSLRQDGINLLIGGKVNQSSANMVSITALDGISFSAQPGDRVGLIGHNGAGKSTLLKVLAGIYRPSFGSLTINGKTEALINMNLGIDLEETGRENMLFALKFKGVPRSEHARIMADIEEFTDLGDFMDLPMRAYSTGMQTRLGFAISTAVTPDILLLDEVVGTGDQTFYAKALARLRSMSDKTKIMFLASHSNALIQEWCNRAIWLEKGKIIMDDKAETVIKEYEKSMT